MRFLPLVLLFLIIACNNADVTYPKSYTFSHIDQTEEALFLITGDASADELDVSTGTYGDARDYIRESTAELMKVAFDLQEIELLSDNMVRINILTDEAEIDTVVTYTTEDKEIIIEALSDTDLIYYDSEEDQFVVCGFTGVAIPGPNANSGNHYNQINVEDCQEGATLTEHLIYYTGQNEVEVLDTIGILTTRIIYK